MSLTPVSQVGAVTAAVPFAATIGRTAGAFTRMLGAALGASPNAPSHRDGIANPAPAATATADRSRAAEISELRAQAQTLEAQFIAQFRALLAAHGIDSGLAVRLGLDDFGNVRVVGTHPQAASIDHALADDPALSGLFQQLAATRQSLQAATGRSLEATPFGTPSQWSGSTGRDSVGFILTIPPSGEA